MQGIRTAGYQEKLNNKKITKPDILIPWYPDLLFPIHTSVLQSG
jgi:hypothetical protein